jgi:uncharacterized membrane protein YczE
MTGLNARYGWPLAAVRTGLELMAVTSGWVLGGTVGIGSVLYALLVGHAVSFGVRRIAPHAAPARAS